MSHHLDTPLARQNGQLYIDDLCVFPSNGSTVFVMDVNSTSPNRMCNRASITRRDTSSRCTSMEPISKT